MIPEELRWLVLHGIALAALCLLAFFSHLRCNPYRPAAQQRSGSRDHPPMAPRPTTDGRQLW